MHLSKKKSTTSGGYSLSKFMAAWMMPALIAIAVVFIVGNAGDRKNPYNLFNLLGAGIFYFLLLLIYVWAIK